MGQPYHFDVSQRNQVLEEAAKLLEDAPPLVEFVKNDHGGCLICGFTPKLAADGLYYRKPDVRQMPAIFINDQFVGGLAGLQAALKELGL
jgi:hypothetical protein